MNRLATAAVIWIVGAIAFSACGSSSNDATATGSEDTFGLSEFTIIPPSNDLHAGRVSITAKNLGGEVHELVIVRAPSVESLPKKPDGSVDESRIAPTDKVGEIDDVASRTASTKTFELAAGEYVALCNLVEDMAGSSTTTTGGDSGMHHGSDVETGHNHFAEGMHVQFTVT